MSERKGGRRGGGGDPETARVYQEFLKTFQPEDPSADKTFVRGGVMNAGSGQIAVDSKKEFGFILRAYEIKKRQELQGQKRRLYERLNLSRTEEERCALRFQIAALENATRPRGAPPIDLEKESSTNLYLGNLSPEITEEFLCQQFGKHGVITSVKIMYPRTEEEKRRNRNCGFVSFETRPQAESAKNSLDGKSFYGMVIRIGWGKALRPSFGATPTGMSSGFSDSPFPSTGFSPSPPTNFTAEVPAATPTPPPPPEAELVEVQVPKDRKVKMMIDLLAKYVAEEGHVFEQQVMEKFPPESGRLSFLYEKDSPDNIYYRWRVYAFGQGDTLKAWRLEPFYIYSGGRRARKKAEAAEERSLRAAARGGERLSAADREELEELLRNITRDRASICTAMSFCMSHGSSSAEVCSCLTESLTLPDTALTMRLARMYLLSDLLANSSAQTAHAWTYRHHLEKHLPFIADRWSKVLEDLRLGVGAGGASPRTQQEQWQGVERALYKMTKLWEAWGVYPPAFLRGIEATLCGRDITATILDPEAAAAAAAKCEAAALELADPQLDGEPLAENLRPLIAQFPLWLRPAAMEWLLLDRYQLDRLCQQRGLGVLPSRSSSSSSSERRQKQVLQLARQELYWKLKQEAAEVPLDVLLEAQAAAAAERQAAAAAAAAAVTQEAVPTTEVPEGSTGAQDGGAKQTAEEQQQQDDVASEASDIFVFEREEEEQPQQQQEEDEGAGASAATAAATAESQEARESDRERMRAIELKVTELQVQLEDQSESDVPSAPSDFDTDYPRVSKDEIASRCDALRQKLLEEQKTTEETAKRKTAKSRDRSSSPHSSRKKAKSNHSESSSAQ
ncbi:RRM domain-containing protein, putative [Eimeria mitis]|uniref:RRM domain-containing protein, putative n=1 Tax=Eimeria mitis TaxID=44415 RepID=U6KCB6_9EIME|nr:RRM domain-containing protein, putative [Eimeria mitis]CDJ35599.1 RRM domain-containing protein, putative [Eimeria mitis]